MGKVLETIVDTATKPFKAVTKLVKRAARRVKKIGKSVMKGVSKLSNKLGPIGMIALAVAMPYALGGLTKMIGTGAMSGVHGATGMMGSQNLFIRSIGTIGNQIRTGYQSFNAFAGAAKQSISKTIGDVFTRFAPKGEGNLFTRISKGAKRLYTAGKEKLKSVTPKFRTAKEGTVEFFDMDGMGVMKSSDAAAAIKRGTLDASQLGKQTLSGKSGWFTKVNPSGISADKLVTETINDAYTNTLDHFGTNAKRMFNDIKDKAMEMNTYLNDEQIGSFVENSQGAKTISNEVMSYAHDMDYLGTGTGKFNFKTEIADLGQTGNYTLGTARDRLEGTYNFTGADTFGKQEASKGFVNKLATATSKAAIDTGMSLLKKDTTQKVVDEMYTPFYDNNTYNTNLTSSYDGTSQVGSKGGNLIEAVYGKTATQKIQDYYKHMNIMNSGDLFV